MKEPVFSCVQSGMSVAEAATALEQSLRHHYGAQEYQRLSQSMALQLGELTETDASQFFSMVVFIGQAQGELTRALGLIWVATKEIHDPLMQQLVASLRTTPVEAFLQRCQSAVQAAQAAIEDEGEINP